nr:uncharacterized protein LOC127487323 isoform X2 [Oryctolagus cuniculus]
MAFYCHPGLVADHKTGKQCAGWAGSWEGERCINASFSLVEYVLFRFLSRATVLLGRLAKMSTGYFAVSVSTDLSPTSAKSEQQQHTESEKSAKPMKLVARPSGSTEKGYWKYDGGLSGRRSKTTPEIREDDFKLGLEQKRESKSESRILNPEATKMKIFTFPQHALSICREHERFLYLQDPGNYLEVNWYLYLIPFGHGQCHPVEIRRNKLLETRF